MKKRKRIFKKILKISGISFLIVFGLFIVINLVGYLYSAITPKIDIKSANVFYLYDKDNNLIFCGNENKEWASLDDISDLVVDATIAVEDKNFYRHKGFDYFRIMKAMLENIKAHEIVQGASTITQQYARNLFLNFDKTWSRKWKEMWLTFELETHYNKDEILEGYLNTINYGHGVYGISNASKFYFNKSVSELSLAEASMLAGIPNSPSNYSPINNYEAAKSRQKVVLERMYNNKYISKEEMNEAYNEELNLYGVRDNLNLTSLMYYQDAVMEELYSIEAIPESYLETGGIKIYTSFDIEAQTALENSVKDNMVNDEVQVSKIMMRSKTGEVIGLIGGSDYNTSSFNRALSSLRQPGSTIKPFLYYKALEAGFTSSTTFLSQETTFHFSGDKTYSPKNSGGVYGNKEISLALALAYSDNIYAVKTHLFLGEDELVSILRKVGISTSLEAVPSLPLGTYEVNILELTSAYASLANLGTKVNAHFINKVEDINGNVLYSYDYDNEEVVLDSSYAFIINELLTGSYDGNLVDYAYPTCMSIASRLTHKYALKSGSTDTDAWVIGFTPDVVLASWAGYDDSSNIASNVVSSNKVSWASAMEEYLKDKESSWYDIPSNVSAVLVNPVNGQAISSDSSKKKIMYYINGTEPKSINYIDYGDDYYE